MTIAALTAARERAFLRIDRIHGDEEACRALTEQDILGTKIDRLVYGRARAKVLASLDNRDRALVRMVGDGQGSAECLLDPNNGVAQFLDELTEEDHSRVLRIWRKIARAVNPYHDQDEAEFENGFNNAKAERELAA